MRADERTQLHMNSPSERKGLKGFGRLVVATHNPGKAREIADLLRPFGVDLVTAGDLGLPEPEETETTFRGNAELKARAAAAASGLPALADDSGMAAEALGGAPGVYSARWAGPEKDFAAAMKRVEDALSVEADPDGETDRRASFICVLSLAWPDGRIESFEGEVRGRLVWPPRGEKGFGYDPMFAPEGEDETFGEMEPERKHGMSHRARAFAKLTDWLGQ
jgi:XTP/dITP diphosphohydrolase